MAGHPPFREYGAGAQRGAVLYVALILLILLALIGIAGMRVSGLQERMAANYRNTNAAFQATELSVRALELEIERAMASRGKYAADTDSCTPMYDPMTWAMSPATDQEEARHTRRIDKCFPSSSVAVGRKLNEETGNIYQVTALDSDAARTSSAVIDTIFIP